MELEKKVTVTTRKVLVAFCLLFLVACTAQKPPVSPALPSLPSSSSSVPETTPAVTDEAMQQRNKMAEGVAAMIKVEDQRVIDAMKKIPRHAFVPPDYAEFAYNDTPLPIGFGQTISAPSIVALMTELLELKKGEKVLEIGTGSGYQAAMLAEVEDVEVYTIEIVPELAESTAERLAQLGYEQIHLKQGDGYYGWQEYAPFDAIIVTAAPDHLPAPLVQQLKEGGRLVIPIGPPGGYQTLWKFVIEAGQLKAYNITGVAFVPFTGERISQEESEETPPP